MASEIVIPSGYRITPEDIRDILSRYTNSMSHASTSGKALADAITCDHPTLQQSMVGLMFHTLLALGKNERWQEYTDPRNEKAAAACKALADLVESGDLSVWFPLI